MCTSKEKLIFDTYVEGDLITNDLIEVVQKKSKVLDCEIYRGIFAPNVVLKVGDNINKYYCNKIMSFSKNFNIAKEFSKKFFIDENVLNSLNKDGYNVDYSYKPDDESFFSKVIIRMKNQKSLDLYDDYKNKAYEREKEVLVLTEPLYIQSITKEDDTVIVDCVDLFEIAKSYMIYM
ncbi:MAG: hypothetical protein Q8900_11175 [Bacillota bacterium]|nr:hypothetical protein [Bacillota bacterium]